MTKWVSTEWFELSANDSSVITNHSSASASEGSGATPAISLAVDYLLRAENGEVITDEAGDPLSLEGI